MKQRSFIVIIAVACLLAAAVCFVIAFSGMEVTPTDMDSYGPDETTTALSSTTTSSGLSDVLTTTTNPYVSPVDFESLHDINEDIYAWIRIPGTNVDYPVVQSQTDDSFYLDHGSDKSYTIEGAIFSEHLYNSTDFTDAMTVLYGHNMASGAMFGDFQSLYWDREFLLENDTIQIFLPDRELEFEIFAALPYSRMHLLHYYHIEKEKAFTMFVDDIYATRHFNTVLIEDRKPVYGDQLLVLSTCLSGDNRYRYLLLGVCKDNN